MSITETLANRSHLSDHVCRRGQMELCMFVFAGMLAFLLSGLIAII